MITTIFHWGRSTLFEALHTDIISGLYTPGKSLPVRVEKKYGVTRTLVVPSPEDALVLQCIVEHILPIALSKQPSKNSFFSRSHGFSQPQIQFEKDYIWFKRWAQFSKVRFEVASSHSHVVITDIANYF